MRVIALTGLAGSGKDTASYLLQMMTTNRSTSSPISIEYFLQSYKEMAFSQFNMGSHGPATGHFHVFKFAWPVYQVISVLLGRSADDLISDPTFKTQVQAWGLTGRQILQKVGTECFRNVISKEVWIDVMDRNLRQDIPGAIISDLRFPNEAEFLKYKFDATIVRLMGRQEGISTDHPSESGVEEISADYTIHNDGDFKDLAMQLETVCQRLKIFNAKYTWK